MFRIICVTNRKLCEDDFLLRIEKIAPNVSAIILREKDLLEDEYKKLAVSVMKICEKYEVELILHTFTNVAISLGVNKIHVPLDILRSNPRIVKDFSIIGVSIHSVSEAAEAKRLGATYVTAGHIFITDCKKGLPGRGIDFLKSVIETVSDKPSDTKNQGRAHSQNGFPVYAIGGIYPENIDDVQSAGASGACIMSGLMTCENPENMCKKLLKIPF